MARRELGPAALQVASAVAKALPGGEFIVGCSGGPDSVALALGAKWAADRVGVGLRAVIVDHGLQTNSAQVAQQVIERLAERDVPAISVRIRVDGDGGLEAAAREGRLRALAEFGVPVLLGHTLDDQAETVLLGLVRGSGTRSLAGMAQVRGPFIRPLLGITRATTVQACQEWGIETWQDPHNEDGRYTRVRIRERILPMLEAELGPGIAKALARTAALCRADADALDARVDESGQPNTAWLSGLADAIRWRTIRRWLIDSGAGEVDANQVGAVDSLVMNWRGQKGVDVPGGRVRRVSGILIFDPR